MYSYGSSARVGVGGKRGHGGGRPHRPPRKRRDPDTTPPPLKECSCLVEIHLPEYRSTQPNGVPRVHESFGGRQALERCERYLRSYYQVHLMVPGKKQKGPVTMVCKTYREAIPALACLFQEYLLLVPSPSPSPPAPTSTPTPTPTPILGRIHRNVKDPQIGIIEGSFLLVPSNDIAEGEEAQSSSSSSLPYWLFRSPDWSVLACSLLPPPNQEDTSTTTTTTAAAASATNNDDDRDNNKDAIIALQTCLDNIIFRLGKESIGQLDIFMDNYNENSFAVGNTNQGEILRREVITSFQQQQ